MRKLDVYVETSVWSHALADDAPEARRATLDFFAAAGEESYQLFVSEVVLEEISRAAGELAHQMEELVDRYHPVLLEFDEEAARLADEYVEHGAVPPSKRDDARHVAVAVTNEMDALVSWNYRHLVSVRRRERFHQVSVFNGYYKPLHIVTPAEVQHENQ